MDIEVISTAAAADVARFDAIIDVRSPAEFAEDHVPGAINLPVLDNEERAEVGTIYVQQSAFLARRIGAAKVARNVARHLETALKDQAANFKPLVYCWRGGQRSNAMATILSQVGWRTALLGGGYKTYRRRVQARLYDEVWPLRMVLLDGGTGSGKTEILRKLATRGVQTLDLEGLANHRGSLFGGFADAPQPHQKMFESRLLTALDRVDPARPVVAEAESSKIGDLNLPPALWERMKAAQRVEIVAPPAERARYLARTYHDIVENRDALEEAFRRLPTHPGRERLHSWRAMADAGDHTALAQALVELHYDPAYARGRKKDARPRLRTVTLEALDEDGLEAAVGEVQAALQAHLSTSELTR